MVYHLLSLATYAVVRLKLRIGDEETPNPEIPTVTTVWPGADWFEREVYDLFGIRFNGHPNQTRILMPQDWVGPPATQGLSAHGHSSARSPLGRPGITG